MWLSRQVKDCGECWGLLRHPVHVCVQIPTVQGSETCVCRSACPATALAQSPSCFPLPQPPGAEPPCESQSSWCPSLAMRFLPRPGSQSLAKVPRWVVLTIRPGKGRSRYVRPRAQLGQPRAHTRQRLCRPCRMLGMALSQEVPLVLQGRGCGHQARQGMDAPSHRAPPTEAGPPGCCPGPRRGRCWTP